jgi:DNA-binding CsgD family transcriptional regulator
MSVVPPTIPPRSGFGGPLGLGGSCATLVCPLDWSRPAPRGLTEQEWHVLSGVAHGYSNRGIAETLHISRKTVEAHLSNVFLKLHIEPRPDRNQRVCAVLFMTGPGSGAPVGGGGSSAWLDGRARA